MNAKWLLYLVSALTLFLSSCRALRAPMAPASATPAPASPPPATAKPAAPTPATSAPGAKEATLSLTWLGQSTFILTTSTGLRALLDPTGPGTGYTPVPVADIDLVTISHEHSDHNAASLASGSPLVLHGLAENDWAKIDQTVKGVRVRTVPTFHDDTQGSQRGKNAVFVFELSGLRLAHMGDLGHTLTPEQITATGPVDVILIPVGGFFTVDGKTAARVVGQLNPKIIVPMHYKTADLSASLAGRLASEGDFVGALGNTAAINKVGQTIIIESGRLPVVRTIMLMKYK